MKYIFILIACALFACNSKKKDTTLTDQILKPEFAAMRSNDSINSDDLNFMKSVGLYNSHTFYKNILKYESKNKAAFEAKYNAKYLSQYHLNVFLKEKGLLIGAMYDYKAEIPVSALKQFKANYTRLVSDFDEFKNFNFIRVSRQSKNKPGLFLQKIDGSEIEHPERIFWGQTLNNPQNGQANEFPVLSQGNYEKYSKLYKVPIDKITVDGFVGSQLFIVAQKEYFNMEGNKIIENKIVPKDPAILLKVADGYLVLAIW